MSVKTYKIRVVPAAKEEAFMKRWHYSRKTVPNSAVKLGCFSGPRLVGVATFGRIINCKPIFKSHSNREGLELNRLAMSDEAPKNSESFFLMRSIKLIAKQYGWLKFISTWADGLRCEGGTIYKACGFHYLRKIPIGQQYLLPSGEVIHQVAFNKVYLKRHYERLKKVPGRLEKVQAVFGPEVRELQGGYQYHYVHLLDKSLGSDFAMEPKPYEKVEKAGERLSSSGRMPVFQTGGSGSIPTQAHKKA